MSLSLRAPLPTAGPGGLTRQGLPGGSLPALHFNVTVRDSGGTPLTFNDGVYDPSGQGQQRSLLLNSADRYAATLLLPAGTYTFETAAKDGDTDASSTDVLLAYGSAPENTFTLNDATHSASLKFHSVLDPAGSNLALKDSASEPSANTPLDLSLRPVTARVNGVAFPLPTSDYSAPTYTLAQDSQSTLNGAGSALGVNVTPNDETLNVTASFQAWLRQGGSDIAVLTPVNLNFQHAVTGVSNCGTRVNLAVGQVATYSGASAARLCLPGGGAGQEYAAIPFNASSQLSYSVTTPLTFNASNIVAPTMAQLSVPSPSPQNLMGEASPALSEVTPPREDLNALLRKPNSRVRVAGLRAQGIPAGTVPAVGDILTLNAAQGCSGTADNRKARVESVSSHAVVVQEVAESSPGIYSPAVPGGFSRMDYDYIGKNFDVVYDEVTKNFGAPSDADSNGHVVLFFTRKINELSPPASSVVTNGLFLPKDLFSADPANGCANSNAGEIIDLLVPDPTGAVNSNVRTVSFVAGNVTPTLARELTRLVNASRRMYVTGASAFEQDWLDQGLAYEALELMFYRSLSDTMYAYPSSGGTWTPSTPCPSGGLAPRQNIALTNLTTGACASRRVAAFNTYQNQIYTIYRTYLQHPNTNSIYLKATNSGTGNNGQGTVYSATTPFLRYAADRKGGQETDFWKSLVDSNLEGVANLQHATGADPQDWLRDWTVATYTDDKANLTGLDARYTQPSWNYRSVFGGLGGFPLQILTLLNNSDLTLNFHSGAAAYLALGVAAGQDATLTAQSGGTNPPASMSVSVVRVK